MSTAVSPAAGSGTRPGRRAGRMQAPVSPRVFTVWLAIITVVGVLFRWLYVWRAGRKIPLGISDAGSYFYLGRNIAEGRGYIRPYDYLFHAKSIPTAEFPPLYPTFLAGVHLIGITQPTGQKLATSVLGATIVVLIGLIGRRVAGPVVGLVAALLAALYPVFAASDGGLASETLYGVLVAAFLLAFLVALEQPSAGRWVLVGALVGLAALTRSEAVALYIFVIAPVVLFSRRRIGAGRGRGWGPALQALGLAALASLVVVTPWLIRDRVATKTFVPISNNSGTMIAGANCPEAYYSHHLGQWLYSCVQRDGKPGTTEAEQASHYRTTGQDYARDHAGRLPYVAAVRVLRTWGVWDFRDEINLEAFESRDHGWLTAGHWMYFAMVPFTIAGIVIVARRRRRFLRPLATTMVMVVFVSAITYGNQRFRLVAEPAIIVFAAVGLVRLASLLWPSLWDRSGDDGSGAVGTAPPPEPIAAAGPVG